MNTRLKATSNTQFSSAVSVSPLRNSRLQRSSTNETEPATAPSIVKDVLRSQGKPLDSETCSFMESRFGHDFSQVRVHTDAKAAESARAMGARAYTVVKDVVFGEGYYSPKTPEGRTLLSHELVHVVQQIGGPAGVRRRRGLFETSTEELHRGIAEEFRSVFGLPPGGVGRFGEPVGPSTSEIIYGGLAVSRSSDVPDLPILTVERLLPAITSSDARIRQAALDVLTARARTMPSLGIDWRRVRFVRYDPASTGSRTEAADPMNMGVWIGTDPFSSVSDLYSTFRHELVHVIQHHDHQRAISRGIGVKEVYAYLWELEHAQGTGLAQRANWGIDASGRANTSVGLSRVLDGLFRNMTRMAAELHANPNLIPRAEVQRLGARVACALLAAPWQVVSAVSPSIRRQDLQSACRQPQSTPSPTPAPARSADSGPVPLGITPDSSPVEREAEALAARVLAGESVAGRIGRRSPLVMRDMFQQPSHVCTLSERHSFTQPAPSCCTLPMLQEIWRLRAQAIPIVGNAFCKLSSPRNVRRELWDHFRVRPDDDIRLAYIRDQFSSMRNAIYSEDVLFMCRDIGDPGCGRYKARADNCSSTTPRRMWFCADIVFGPPFLGRGWLKTVIHEYAHIGCPSVGRILPEGSEFYMGRPGYPPSNPDVAIRNADSYASFALAVR